MSTTALQRPRLSNEQMEQLLTLTKGADTVELKLTVPDSDRRSAVAALGIDPLDAQIRQVIFFDTPDLTLNQAGVVVRARRVQQRKGDSVIKLRPVTPSELPGKLRRSPYLGVEVDAMPGGFVCSASMKGEAADADVRAACAGRLAVRKPFSREQRDFFARYAPHGIELDDLSILGPINVFKLRFVPRELNRKMVAEMWFYPDNTRILELSTKCLPSEAFQTAAELRVFLSHRGIETDSEQHTKTKTALEYFSNALHGAA